MTISSFRILLSVVVLIGAGCMSEPEVVAKVFQSQIDSSLTFQQLYEDSTVHQGTMMLLTSEVLSATLHLAEEMCLEILQIPVDDSDEPGHDRTASQGRFLPFESFFLDPATLPPHTRVMLVCVVRGITLANLDEMEYQFPTVMMKHLHVWPTDKRYQSGSSGPPCGIFGGDST